MGKGSSLDIAKAIRKAKRVYLIGNGGSYANAMHICNDLNSCGIKAHVLDPATLTAYANDHGFEYIYSLWLSYHGDKNDLLIALSGSGNSPNILEALKMAKTRKMTTWAIIGDLYAKPGKAMRLADRYIIAGNTMQDAEDQQLKIGHEILRWLKNGS